MHGGCRLHGVTRQFLCEARGFGGCVSPVMNLTNLFHNAVGFDKRDDDFLIVLDVPIAARLSASRRILFRKNPIMGRNHAPYLSSILFLVSAHNSECDVLRKPTVIASRAKQSGNSLCNFSGLPRPKGLAMTTLLGLVRRCFFRNCKDFQPMMRRV